MSDSTTKQCPFCAETIQAAAIVCRYCGRSLVPPPVTLGPSDRELLDKEIAEYTRAGWRITSQTPTAFQTMRPRKWSNGALAFVLLCLLGGIF